MQVLPNTVLSVEIATLRIVANEKSIYSRFSYGSVTKRNVVVREGVATVVNFTLYAGANDSIEGVVVTPAPSSEQLLVQAINRLKDSAHRQTLAFKEPQVFYNFYIF